MFTGLCPKNLSERTHRLSQNCFSYHDSPVPWVCLKKITYRWYISLMRSSPQNSKHLACLLFNYTTGSCRMKHFQAWKLMLKLMIRSNRSCSQSRKKFSNIRKNTVKTQQVDIWLTMQILQEPVQQFHQIVEHHWSRTQRLKLQNSTCLLWKPM